MRFDFRPMNSKAAREIAAWHYEGIYSFYDFEADPLDHEMLLNPENWENCWYAAYTGDEIVGFFEFFEAECDEMMIGLGLRPDLTGQGLGLTFVKAGLDFGDRVFSPKKYELGVATFNTRAIKVYEQAGFIPVEVYEQETNGGMHEFLKMIREV